MRRDVAIHMVAGAGPARNNLVARNDGARNVAARVGLGFPAHLAGLGVERDQETVRRSGVDHVVPYADGFGARLTRLIGGNLALVFPDEIAVGGIQSVERST